MSANTTHRRPGRARWLVGLVGLALATSATVGNAANAVPVQSDSATAAGSATSIDAEVTKALAEDGKTSFWVHFAARPRLARYGNSSDWNARGKAVYNDLASTAKTSQATVRGQLDKQKVPYESFHIVNAIKVESGDAALVKSLASSPGVDRIEAPFEVTEPDDKVEQSKSVAAAAVSWGVADIKADKVWSERGVTGQGIVIANIDTGVQYDHPALVNQYRGNKGDGTFDHNYNWLDVSGGETAPHDENGHGTHTMGTMVGSDGGNNLIGVAPGAKWIAANGCCPSDAALIKSMEWMLAPTDSKGENPDPSKRPNIVNNSWGTTEPSNDPFGEELQAAWTASGIFGVFANSNSGPGCVTSGSPGSRAQNYSVGNYTRTHEIAESSSRGSGQDGEIKPNIAAPGTDVRSSIPGNAYANYTGTSMAAPHAAGAVALLWSGSPSLVGDVEATRELLDGSAIDTEDLQCGGSAADNNVFGEGRLDVLAAMDAAPSETTGALSGVITNGATGKPVSDATVTVTGDITRTVTTDSDGKYTSRLVEGSYKVDVTAFGYDASTADVTITPKQTTAQDFTLEPAPSTTVSGTVTDASGHGWPLYAAISVDGTPIKAFTDPETGAYSFQAPVGATYRITADVQSQGYVATTKDVAVTDPAPVAVDFGATIDAETCLAPGYKHHSTTLFSETFDAITKPEGWTVVNEGGLEPGWQFTNLGTDNKTGGQGNFARVDAAAEGAQDSSLISPSIDLSDASAPVLDFKHDFVTLFGSESGTVDVSTDGGTTWTKVHDYQNDAQFGESLPLPMAAGKSDVKVRFHYVADLSFSWSLDDVALAERPCRLVEGGLVVGNVLDATSGEGLVGAQVTNKDATSEKVFTGATAADENLGEGFYSLFSAGAGTHRFEAVARRYSPGSKDVTVAANKVTRADFKLKGGKVEVSPRSIETKVTLGKSTSKNVTVTNKGAATVHVAMEEVRGSFELLNADGTRQTSAQIAKAEGAPEIAREVKASIAQAPVTSEATRKAQQSDPSAAPWVDLGPLGTPTMDNRVVALGGTWYSIGGAAGSGSTNRVQRYDPSQRTWVNVANLPVALASVSAAVIDGKIIVSGGWLNGSVSKGTFSYDPATDAWTQKADAPFAVSAAGSAVVNGKLYVVAGCTTTGCTPMTKKVAAYDPATNTWTRLADYPLAVGFLACGGLDEVICAGGNDGNGATNKAFAYDARIDLWTEIASLPVDIWGAYADAANGQLVINSGMQADRLSNRTFGYLPEKDEWEGLPNSNTAGFRGGAACGFVKVGGQVGNFVKLASAEQLPGFDSCDGAGTDVEWMTPSVELFTLKPGKSATIEVETTADVAQPGTYTATLRLSSDAPGKAVEVPVTMTVDPPRTWGKLLGTVTGVSCADGSKAPLAGATVDIIPRKGGLPGWYLSTNAEGKYATWFDARVGKVDVVVGMDSWRPASEAVRLTKGATLVKDFALVRPSC